MKPPSGGSDRQKQRVIMLSLVSNTCLVIIKILVGLATGLVSIIAEAVHSANDLLTSIIAFFGVKKSSEPPDESHQFGHGKVEVITGTIESMFILGLGIYIIYEGISGFFAEKPHEFIEIGIAVMLFSGIVNLFISSYMIKRGRELRSIGVEVDGEHLRADVITSFGVAAALIIMKFTGWHWLDPAAAIIIGLWILQIFVRLIKKLMFQNLDAALDENELKKIRDIIDSIPEIKSYHRIRTRQGGSTVFIDMHIKVDPQLTVETSHEVTRNIEKLLGEAFGDVNVLIHVEPFSPEKLP
ncbi:MAG TPA: cation transporter [bacterium]|nr:cation transporter [bacterium]